MKIYSPARYEPRDLPAGTRVQGAMSGRVGVVQKHVPNRMGTFPVRWNDPGTGALWETCGADDVTVVADVKAGAA